MQNNIYIKIPKTFVKTHMNTKDKKCLLITYLFFHTTYDKEVYTSIDCICSELKLSTKSHGARRSQNIIKDLLNELIQEQIIEFISTSYCKDFYSLTNNQLFKIKINHDSVFFNSSSNYVRIEKSEYDALCLIDNCILNKIFNIFYQIKSHICMDDNCLHICYPSFKTLCALCGCSDNTLLSILKILHEKKLIYVYKLNNPDKMLINRNIEYIFALEPYNRKQVLNEFVA